MTGIVIRGGLVVDEDSAREATVRIDAENGVVAAVESDDTGAPEGDGGALVLDATGCVVCPGFVDLATHLRQPGDEAAETIDTAARAAAVGGYTAVVAMPDTDPCMDSAAVVAEVRALAKSAACEIVPSAMVTVGGAGTNLAPLGELVDAGVRLFTDPGGSIADAAVLRRGLEYLGGIAEAAGAKPVLAARGDLAELADGGVMNEGEWSSRLGLPGRPAVAEQVTVARDLAVARLAGAPLHLQQVSTATAVALIRAAKADGQPVTCDVSPHHLVLDESTCATYDPNLKVLPPLRTTADAAALLDGLIDGTIDAVATDHSPWVVDAKERPFDEAPFGVIGLETALAALLSRLDVTIEQLLPALSWRPAAIAGLADRHGGPIAPGRPANLTVVDPAATWTVEPARLASRSANTPFAGHQLRGKVRHTLLDGRPTVVDGSTVEEVQR